jgi:enoyl-CoA hydratase
MDKMDFNHVSIEKHGRIAVVRFDRGDGVNALSRELKRELIAAARSFEDDIETSAIVLTGAADVFSLGFDLKDPTNAEVQTAGLAERRMITQLGPRLCRAWEDLEPMTFVALEGWCVGGGAALAVACDVRVIGEGGTLYVPEIERGMNMSWQSVPRIVNLVGPSRAKRIIIMAERIDAGRALDWGLVDEVTPTGGAFAKAMEMAERVASLPPVQVRMCKRGINAAANAGNDSVSALDIDQFLLSQTSADFAEGVNSFLEGRPPRYSGQ